tara:strand:- start:1028 stop:1609 length:582 start_codon:yes stop_codon:yes gene_type:complete
MNLCSFGTRIGASFLPISLSKGGGLREIVLIGVKKMLLHIASQKGFLQQENFTTRSIYMWQISAVLGIALMTTGGAFKVYYDKAQAEKETMALEIKQAAQNQVILENSIKSLNDQVLQAEEDKKRAFEQINVLQKANEEARAEVSNLKNKFAKHDMNVLSLRKPKLIENIINKGTKGVLNDFENLTSLSSGAE